MKMPSLGLQVFIVRNPFTRFWTFLHRHRHRRWWWWWWWLMMTMMMMTVKCADSHGSENIVSVSPKVSASVRTIHTCVPRMWAWCFARFSFRMFFSGFLFFSRDPGTVTTKSRLLIVNQRFLDSQAERSLFRILNFPSVCFIQIILSILARWMAMICRVFFIIVL